ncbi:MAG: nucleotide exchange factor GrpE [Henriciella sp.]|nr:nucleotide exchange factor GrpE [Henriciella sp.]
MLKAAKQADKTAVADAETGGNDFGEPVAELEPEIQHTPEQQIMILEAEKEEMRDQLLRTLAEMENIRKRAEREKSEARVYAIERFAGDLLSVADNLERALGALPDDEKAALTEAGKNLFDGIEMTQKELQTVLARHGLTAIQVEPGGVFDPNLHQAVANIPSAYPNGTVAEMFQSGWRIGDRVLRAAMVAVSAGDVS